MEKRKGYWQGKKRDSKTIEALSKSKFKTCYTYDLNGNFVKKYDSYMECAKELIGDYKVKNGSAVSLIYDILQRKNPKNRVYNNLYIFKENEIFKNYNELPKKLDMNEILCRYVKSLPPRNFVYKKPEFKKVYKVIVKYDDKEIIFNSVKECAKFYNKPISWVNDRVKNRIKEIVKFEYGEKHYIKNEL